MSLTGLILAAGHGKRMHSDIPKVLHPIAGVPMVEWVIRTLQDIPCDDLCLVLSPNYTQFKNLLDKYPKLVACIQNQANGTAGAVAAAQSYFEGSSPVSYGNGVLLKGQKKKSTHVLICAGDTPALELSILQKFLQRCLSQSSKLGVLGMQVPNPTGYGRLLLKSGKLERIVEEKDADENVKKIQLCNSGIIFAEVEYLFDLLTHVDNKNAQCEFYLTECIQLAVSRGDDVTVFVTDQWQTLQGVNDKEQLASLDAWFRKNKSLN